MKHKTIKKILGSSILLSVILSGCTFFSSSESSVSAPLNSSEFMSSEESSAYTSTLITSINSEVISYPEVSLIPEDHAEHVTNLYTHSEAWGLGVTIEKYVSNNRDYVWYVDQYTTGEYWDANCGPTSVEMAGRFHNPDFYYKAQDARKLYPNDGGWWYDANIRGALEHFGVTYTAVYILNTDSMKASLDDGNILLVNPRMDLINDEASSDHHVGLYYPPGTGHYIIVKGYIVVDGNTLYEVYDPWSLGMTYADGTLKGKDRYYDEVSFLYSIKQWFSMAYAIAQL